MDQIRQNLAMNYAGDEVVRMNPEEKAFASRFSKYINENNALRFYSVLQEAQYEISRNAYSKLLFADLTIKVHYLFLKGNGA